MPTDFAAEASRMAEAFAVVAAGAVPAGVASYLLASRLGRPVLPPWRRPATRWNGFVVLALFVLHVLLAPTLMVGFSALGFYRLVYGPDFPSILVQVPAPDPLGAVGGGSGAVVAGRAAGPTVLRFLWASVVAVPVLVSVTAAAWVSSREHPPRFDPGRFPGRVALGVGAWAVLTPAALAVNFLLTWVLETTGTTPDDHPLTGIELAGRPGTVVLFAGVVCGLIPLAEEVLFRGVLLGWAVRRRVRPWVVIAAGMAFAVLNGGLKDISNLANGRAGFGLLLLGGLAVLTWRRSPGTWRAVYATAAAFGLAHSAVWPTPVPLFVLGLGLGWLTARTRCLVPAAVVHGLFNTVSLVYLVRGGVGGI